MAKKNRKGISGAPKGKPVANQPVRRRKGVAAKTAWSDAVELPSRRLCTVSWPDGMETESLPVLYLFHGQRDWETDWWSERGELSDVLAAAEAIPMLLVAPFCARERLADKTKQEEPPLGVFLGDFEQIQSEVSRLYGGDATRQGIVGISMGGKQAVAAALTSGDTFSALGVLSAKVQGNNLDRLRAACGGAFPERAQLRLRYHYCGGRENETLHPDGVENNETLAQELGAIRRRNARGRHNWNFWRPRLEQFIRKLSVAWAAD